MGKSMGFLIADDRRLTKVLVRIKKRKDKSGKKESPNKKKGGKQRQS